MFACIYCLFFFFNATPTTEIYTLSLYDALPISVFPLRLQPVPQPEPHDILAVDRIDRVVRSEEHTSELQSLRHLVCRLLLEKKKNIIRLTNPKTTHDMTPLQRINYRQ